MDLDNLPEGTDPEELLVPEDPNKRTFSTKWFEYNGKKWSVDIYDDLTMKEVNDIMKESFVLNEETGVMERSNDMYTRALLTRYIKRAPFKMGVKEIIRQKGIVADKIVRLLPYTPIQMALSDDAKKKLSISSGLEF